LFTYTGVVIAEEMDRVGFEAPGALVTETVETAQWLSNNSSYMSKHDKQDTHVTIYTSVLPPHRLSVVKIFVKLSGIRGQITIIN
jgi:hypothetical protein